jgi:hypothetical protein
MLVVMALLIIILAILAEAFAIGLKSLRTGKAIGDMQENLRSAGNLIRRDLAADHFGGRRRLSDVDPTTQALLPRSREGFFHLIPSPGAPSDVDEGNDPDGLPSRRRTDIVLHFAVKLRGNAPDQFFSVGVPAGSPLLVSPTTYFDQPSDARFQPNGGTIYNSQWAEVAYYLQANGTTAGNMPLYDLYRTQLVGVPDPDLINGQVPAGNLSPGYLGVSCIPNGNNLQFLSPVDWASGTRAFNQASRPGTLVLTDVVSFDAQGIWANWSWWAQTPGTNNWGAQWVPDSDFHDLGGDYDSKDSPIPLRAIRVTIRVWDLKTSLTRQATIIQDM